MAETTISSAHAFERRTASIAALLLVALGLGVLAGWVFATPEIRSLRPGWVEMKVNAALGFVLCGAALALLKGASSPGWRRRLGYACAALTCALGGASLVESVSGIDFGIDQLLVNEPSGAIGTPVPGRMAPTAAVNFVLAGMALLLLDRSTSRGRWTDLLLVMIAVTAAPAVVGYLYDVDSFAELVNGSPMAVHTAGGFLVAAAGIGAARPGTGLLGLMRADAIGSLLARRLLPAVVGVPLALGYAGVLATQSNWLAPASSTVVLVLWMITLLSAVVLLSARKINIADAERQRMEANLLQLNQRLDDLVSERTAALDASEVQLRLLVNGVQEYGVWTLDADGCIASWNSGAERITGYAADDVLGRSHTIFFVPDDAAGDVPGQLLRRALQDGWCETDGWRVQRDGTRFWARVILSPLRDMDGELRGYAVLTRDISEERLAEQKRLEAEAAARIVSQRLAKIIDVSPLAIIGLDMDLKATVWNRRAEELFGYTAEEAIGRRLPVTPESQDDEQHQFVDTVAMHKPVYGVAKRRRHKNGRLIDVKISGVTIFDEAGVPTGSVYLLEDMTAQLAVQSQLFQAQKMEAVGQLTGGIAHDFNNLLAVVIGNLDIALEEIAPASPMAELLGPALEAALRGADLTQQMLAFSRRQMLQAEFIDVNERLRGSQEILKRAIGQAIEVNLHLGEPPWGVKVDPAQFDSAVLNLAINARDAMASGGVLTIRTQNTSLDEDYVALNPFVAAGDYVQISVSDTGTGMSPEITARVFEPFFSTKEGKGSGLGLSMVYGFIKQSGGHVKVYSEDGHGTTVRMYLRRAEAEAIETDAEAGEEASAVSADLGAYTVLIVEDIAEVREVAVRQMTEMGLRVLQANDARTALEVLEQASEIDVLFTDVILGTGMSGPALVAEARKRFPRLKVLFASGFADARQAGSLLDGGDPFLHKPYRKQELQHAMVALLTRDDPRV